MEKEYFFLTLFTIWYISNYGIPNNLLFLLNRLYYNVYLFAKNYNDSLSSQFEHLCCKNIDDEDEDEDKENIVEEPKKVETKYEDKYLNDMRALSNDYIFDEIENELINKKCTEFYAIVTNDYSKKLEEIKERLCEIELSLIKYESYNNDKKNKKDEDKKKQYETDNNQDNRPNDDEDTEDNEESDEDNEESDDEDYEKIEYEHDSPNLSYTKEQIIELLLNEEKTLINEEKKINTLLNNDVFKEECIKKAEELSRNYVIRQRIEKLKNCFVIEHTPLGNVLMIYDIERESFKYFSDNNIPYRYLEVVGRKYAKQFGCRQIFVDMEEELKFAEEKWQKESEEKERKEEEKNKQAEMNIIRKQIGIEEKKSVFAKFKSYNKEAGTGRVNIAAPPKNSIPNKKVLTEKQENEKILLKERANRYTYEGKMANFSFLKKIDRKVVDKKFALSFSDFKKMKQTN
jgi:hypothetical protein